MAAGVASLVQRGCVEVLKDGSALWRAATTRRKRGAQSGSSHSALDECGSRRMVMATVHVVTHNSLMGAGSLARLSMGGKRSASMWTAVLGGTCRPQSAHVSLAL
jgi:hypothetical protein